MLLQIARCHKLGFKNPDSRFFFFFKKLELFVADLKFASQRDLFFLSNFILVELVKALQAQEHVRFMKYEGALPAKA